MKALFYSLIPFQFLFAPSCFASERIPVLHGCLMTYIFMFLVGSLVVIQLLAAIVYLFNAIKNSYQVSHQTEKVKAVNQLKAVA